MKSPCPRPEKKHPVLRRVAIATALLLCSGLVSCISLYTGRATIVDSGGAVANIGQQRPRLHPEPQAPAKGETDYHFHYRVWKKGDGYIIEYPVCYAPANYSVLVHRAGHFTWRKTTLDGELPARYTNAELSRYPVELYYAELTEEQYKKLMEVDKRIKRSRPSPFRDVQLRPAAEMDLSGAEPVLDFYDERYHRITRVWNNSRELPPARRTWYNYPLMPVSWVAEVVDIPLSLVATPIGWLADAIYEPLAN